jgi:hypothetical protein
MKFCGQTLNHATYLTLIPTKQENTENPEHSKNPSKIAVSSCLYKN